MLSYHGHKTVLNGGYIAIIQISQLTRDKEITKQKQERFMRTEINFALGKNGGYIPNSLGDRSISVDRQ